LKIKTFWPIDFQLTKLPNYEITNEFGYQQLRVAGLNLPRCLARAAGKLCSTGNLAVGNEISKQNRQLITIKN
jgi:hypothetical protein